MSYGQSPPDREKREGKESKDAKPKLTTRITQQFRERHNMTYELDCDGIAIVIRMFPPDDVKTSEWRFEARASASPEGSGVTATARTAREALDRLAKQCVEQPGALSQVDWRALLVALESVRAL